MAMGERAGAKTNGCSSFRTLPFGFALARHSRLPPLAGQYRGPALLHDAVETVTRAAGRKMRFGSMLDLGCGTGPETLALLRAGWTVDAVDSEPEAIARLVRS